MRFYLVFCSLIRTFAPAFIKGEVLEWLKRHAWKACSRQNWLAGSNPVLSAFRIQIINNKTFLFAITGHFKNVVNAQFGTLFTNNLAFVSLPVFKCFSSRSFAFSSHSILLGADLRLGLNLTVSPLSMTLMSPHYWSISMIACFAASISFFTGVPIYIDHISHPMKGCNPLTLKASPLKSS